MNPLKSLSLTACAAFLLCVSASSAQAARIVKFEVPPGGGAYEVLAHHGDALALAFNEPIEIAYSLHKRSGIVVQRHANEVTVELSPRTRHGSVVVQTKTARVVVGIKASSPDKNAYVAEFKILTPAEEMEKKLLTLQYWQRHHRASVAQQRAQLVKDQEEISEEELERRTAQGIANSHCNLAVNDTAQSKSLIFRVHDMECIGDTAYIRYTVQNTRNTILTIQDVRLHVSGIDKTSQNAFQQDPKKPKQGMPEIQAGARIQGVATLRNFRAWRGAKAVLTVVEASSANRVTEAASVTWFLQ